MPQYEGDNAFDSIQDSFPFLGQIGPIYLFNDAISAEQVKGIYALGPSYMYSFLDNEATPYYDNPLPSGILDAKDGLASRIIFGLNAQVLFLEEVHILKFELFSGENLRSLFPFFRQVVVENCLMSLQCWILHQIRILLKQM